MQLPASITIIYASTSGNVELVCDYAAEILQGHSLKSDLKRVERSGPEDLIKHNLFLLATSTWEHGRINPYFDSLLAEIPHLDLKYKHFGFIGLGDVRYEPVLFCGGMSTLRDTVLAAGGLEVCPPLRINGEPNAQLEEHVRPWVQGFISELINYKHG